MNRFLQIIAQQIVEKHGKDLKNVAIVLPGKRAGLFLKKYLYDAIGSSFFSPEIMTLPDLIKKLANSNSLSPTEQILLLYKSYLSLQTDQPESFEIFSSWASQALQDFSDVEQSLVNPDSLFRDLRDIKEIENWSFNQNPLSETQNDYLKFWNQLGPLFQSFRNAQSEQKKFTYARLCHNVSKSISSLQIPSSIEHLWICGLSGLSIAEKKIIDQLKERKIATVRWDADPYYLDNEHHEAGDFLRKQTSPSDRISMECFKENPKSIQVFQASTGYGQVLIAAELLGAIPTEQVENTAVILTDSSLLLPLIQNLPDRNHAVNIALGLSLKNTPIMNLVRSIAQLEQTRLLKSDRGIYYRYLLRVIEQPALKGLIGEESKNIRGYIAQKRWIYFKEKTILELLGEYPTLDFLKEILLNEYENYLDWIDDINAILARFLENDKTEEYDFECSLRMQDLLFELKTIITDIPELNQIKSIQSMLQHLISKESITFKGEPLEGLQVLNMVETRALDFENIIFVGANEDQFPGSLMDQSLIPFDLRAFYKLPLIFDKEITYGYTFYRSIQRAKNISFITSAISSDFKGSEQSRYITQLQLELCQVLPENKFSFTRVESFKDQHPKSLEAINDDFTRKRMEQMIQNGISPSALNKYVNCPLDFYYRYILQLGEESTIDETIDQATFGSVVHETLENFFKPFIGSFPTIEQLEEFSRSAEDHLFKSFSNYFGKEDLEFGENKLQVTLALQMLQQIISFEISQAKKRIEGNDSLRIVALEEKLQSEIPSEKTGLNFPIVLKGKTDRIDLFNDTLRILDYKTGSVKDADLKLFNGRTGAFQLKPKAMQLLMYMHMAAAHPEGNRTISPAIFSMKNYKSGWLELDYGDNPYNQSALIELFENKVIEIVKGMLECPSFEHNSSSKFCEYCNR